MKLNLVEKLVSTHLASGKMEPGSEIGLKIDQTLTQDATGTMAYLQFEAIGVPRVRTKVSVSYVDHNMLGTGYENADDHRFLQTMAARYGVYFSRPGNGICHQVHLERFAVPGCTLLGSDSHTATAGAVGMLAIGAGGLDVAVAMAGQPFYMEMPRVVRVELTGQLPPWTSAKDVILELLRRLSVRGGLGKAFEYAGEGVRTLSIYERATIANMGAELGATTSVFPSDEVTREFLKSWGREADWVPLEADNGADYDEVIELDLSCLEPLIAQPHSPDNVIEARKLAGLKVDQVAIGSCTNSSYKDLMVVAKMLEGKSVHPDVSLVVSPGSRAVLTMLADSGGLSALVNAGARILEVACGPCIGMGQAPRSGGVSVRTYNRNFEGRSGTADAKVYLASAEVAAAAAIHGCIVDPRECGDYPKIDMPSVFPKNDSMIIPPPVDGSNVQIERGPNIKPLPKRDALPQVITGEVLLKLGDNITTDHIMPAGAKVLPLRSNIPAMSEYAFNSIDPSFPARSKEKGGGLIVAGSNYGQGSSREHAAMVPMYLGLKAVIAKSFARIHKQNLINFGILPLMFESEDDWEAISQGDHVEIDTANLRYAPDVNSAGRAHGKLTLRNLTTGQTIALRHDLTPRQVSIILAGGLLNLAGKSH